MSRISSCRVWSFSIRSRCSEPIMPQSGPVFAPCSDYPSCHARDHCRGRGGSLLAAWFGGTRGPIPRRHLAQPSLMALAACLIKLVEAPGVPLWIPAPFRDAGALIPGSSTVARRLYLQSTDAGGVGWRRSCFPPDMTPPAKNKPITSATATSSAAHRPRNVAQLDGVGRV